MDRPIAKVKTMPVVKRALSEGWSWQRIRAQVERVPSGNPIPEEEAAEAKPGPMCEVKVDRFGVHEGPGAGLGREREAVL